jgi:porphobilinogen deaminase
LVPSSYRREFQIKKIRSDLNCKLIRGNVDTRIKKLNDGLYDAIILSYAGIKSLSIEDKISRNIFNPRDNSKCWTRNNFSSMSK